MKTSSFTNPKCLLSLALLLWQGITLAQAPAISWQKSLGGSNDEYVSSIQQTTDGGYILAGESHSNNGDVTGNHGSGDYWIVKLDSNGTLTWQKCLGGSNYDGAYSIQQTTDGGYIVAGWSISNNGDVTGNHGGYDYWIIKLEVTGDISWQKSLGGSSEDYAYSVEQTTDGGYIVAGVSHSNDGDVTGNHGDFDYWIVKLDANGNLSWQKCLGGTSWDNPYSVEQTTDGGYIVAGWSYSYDGDVIGNHGNKDYWIVKLDSTGNLSWQKCLGGSSEDQSFFIEQTTDGGYIVVGQSYSNNGNVTGNHGGADYWIVKLAANGTLSWQKSLGGSSEDYVYSVEQTLDGGYIVAGESYSNDGNVTGNQGDFDYWIVKLTANGNLSWQKSLGGSARDYVSSVEQTLDGGYIVAGSSQSNDGDVIGNHGNLDYWIVKLSNFGVGIEEASMVGRLSVSPNPVVGNNMSIDYYLSAATEVEISMIDVFGKELAYIKNRTKTIGEQSQVIYVGHLASGVYFVELRTGYEVWRGKVVKE